MFSDTDYDELETSVFEILDHNISNDIDYDNDDIIDCVFNDLINISIIDPDFMSDPDLKEIINECISCYYTIFDNTNIQINPLHEQLRLLKEVYQPQQRTPEWYEFRHGLITASMVWKIFKSNATLNSLIYEKCLPYSTKQIFSHSLEWGKKYEAISIMLYEKRFQTKVAEFGCISHPTYSFLGASPDGINVEPNSSKYGTMIEVKNIVNRLILNKPKDEYWIQMQIQMEVCNLENCDFIETRFKEYDEIQFNEDILREKGIILVGYFMDNYTPHYHYTQTICAEWIKNTIENYSYSFHKILYWYLDEFSCISVQRDREWFNKSIPKITETWELICLEKNTGFDHRKPKQKNIKNIPHSDLFDLETQNTDIKVIKLK